MKLQCAFGFHQWSGCKCSRCAKTRNEGHDWSKDCEKCATCGATRSGSHAWAGCKCASCRTTRDEGHDWSKDCEKCSQCSKTRFKAHEWTSAGEKCSKCGRTNPNTQFDLGCKHMLESIRKRNAPQAIPFLESAARAGHSEAKNMLGLLLVRKGDLRGGYKWLCEAAEAGSSVAGDNRKAVRYLLDNSGGIAQVYLSYSWGAQIPKDTPANFQVVSVMGNIELGGTDD